MTELMQRYEEKMDLKKDSIRIQYVYDRFIEGFEEFAQEEYDALQSENTHLKAQLTWRPVSEKPKVTGIYLVKFLRAGALRTGIAEYDESFINDSLGIDGWYDMPPFVEITHWLPIPPAPEGELHE
jgi:hypothetical protein